MLLDDSMKVLLLLYQLLHQFEVMLERHVGYCNRELPRSTYRDQVLYLLKEGWHIGQLRRELAQHDQIIDAVRHGDELIRLDGAKWLYMMRDGQFHLSRSDRIVVTSTAATDDGRVMARDPRTGQFGEIELANVMFDICV